MDRILTSQSKHLLSYYLCPNESKLGLLITAFLMVNTRCQNNIIKFSQLIFIELFFYNNGIMCLWK